MKKKTNRYLLAFILIFFAAAAILAYYFSQQPATVADERVVTKLNPAGALGIVTVPVPTNFKKFFAQEGQPKELPHYNPDSENPFQVDLRSRDVSHLDMTGRLRDLLMADFDSGTVWPEQLPAGFEPGKLMEEGKNPGLGVRALQAKGITGKGVGIAIIDQVLLTTHQEYKDRVKSYEMLHCYPGSDGVASMHGAAVSSIALGKTVGVAPEANLYYIAATFGDYEPGGNYGKFDYDCGVLAQAIERVLEINKMPQVNGEIRVISVSWGPSQKVKNYTQYRKAVERAKKEKVLVITTSMSNMYGTGFAGLDRKPYQPVDNPANYLPGSWLQKRYFDNPDIELLKSCVWLPMGNRTTASPTGDSDYVYYAEGGYSWVAPYLAGLYALACQVNPQVTPEQFLNCIMQTGDCVTIQHQARDYRLGPIANPQKLLYALKK